jgi:hypothetical protein
VSAAGRLLGEQSEQALAGRVAMGRGRAPQGRVAFDDLHQAEVGDRRHCEAGHVGERLVVIERGREHAADVGEERRPPLGGLRSRERPLELALQRACVGLDAVRAGRSASFAVAHVIELTRQVPAAPREPGRRPTAGLPVPGRGTVLARRHHK